MPLPALLFLAITLFAATNLDDILVLVGFFAQREFRARAIVCGQYTGILLLFMVGVASSLMKLVVPPAYLGLLGIAPVLIGAKKLLAVRDAPAVQSQQEAPEGGSNLLKQAVQVAAVTIANGGDNLGVYIPAFAVRSAGEIIWIAAVFVGMTAVWCWLAHALVHHTEMGRPIRRYGHIIAPIVLIALGLGILYQAGSFGLWRKF